MTDRTIAAGLMNYLLAAGTVPPITAPLRLRLMTGVVPTSTTNGTELTAAAAPGYTATGLTLGSPAFNANAGGISTSANAVTWTATAGATWPTVTAAEIWDSTATPKRVLFGALSAPITGVGSGDTVTFAPASITADASGW
jgi:hypothetical protein